MIMTDKKFVRDMKSKALLSKDRQSLENNRRNKKKNDELNTLREEVTELRNLVMSLISKDNNG